MRKKKNPHIGSSLDDWIAEETARDPDFERGVEEEYTRIRLARELRALRERKHLTQAQLAKKVGTLQPAIARIESGGMTPSLDVLKKVARALGARLEVHFVPSRV